MACYDPQCDNCPCPPGCFPCPQPYAQVIMTCPPPILAPTRPEPVKALQLPCPPPTDTGPEPLTPEELERSRFDNFYNNYNTVESPHANKNNNNCCCCRCPQNKKVSKKERICEDYTKTYKDDEYSPEPGCPTGFKPCTMKLTAPPNCDPYGVWCAEIQPCPPKPPKKKTNQYVPGPCRKPCCKHWKPKEGPCLYDDPCKAHCYNHPPGIKPSGRFP